MSDEQKLAIVISSVLAVIIGVLVFLFHPVERTGKVKAMFWERTIYMEEYMKVKHEGTHLPAGAEIIRVDRRTKRVSDGKDSNGKTKYRTEHYNYYYYYLKEWKENHIIIRTCGFDKEPYWNEEEAQSKTKIATPYLSTLGDIRPGRRVEEYMVTFTEQDEDEIKQREMEVSLSKYLSYNIGSQETYKVPWIKK